jgi:hypothetical protein
MKPDPDMMRQALVQASEALEAIQKFQSVVGFSFGADATQTGAYTSVCDLADRLLVVSDKLNRAALSADERLRRASSTL